MNTLNKSPSHLDRNRLISEATSELNNLLQVIANTSALIEKDGNGGRAGEYRAILRTSIERAEAVAAQLANQAGGTSRKTVVHPNLGADLPKPSGLSRRSPSILVVDDEPTALLLVQQILRDAGFEATAAESGFAALDLFRQRPYVYDLVLLDLTMPFMDGEETFTRLREIRAEIPVVICTGFIQQERLDHLMTVGLSGFMRKPIGSEEMIGFINSILASVRYSGGTRSSHMPVAI